MHILYLFNYNTTEKRRHWGLFGLVLAALFVVHAAQAQDAIYQKTDHGIRVKVGEAQVELAAETPTALRLSISYKGTPTPASSIFLADQAGQIPVTWEPIQQAGFVGIKTAAGELLIDPATRKWTLEDARGQTLIPPCEIGQLIRSNVVLNFGWGKDEPVIVYGCGNGTPGLEQSNVLTHLANGVAVIPYYWSPVGYGAMAVTANDDKPATWHAAPGQGYGTWNFPGNTADLYLMPTADLHAAAKAYAQLSGLPAVPPRWTFGYLQSRWGWKDRAYIEDTLKQFSDRKLPVDAFIFDFEWYTKHPDYSLTPAGEPDFEDFSWNSLLFPEPAAQITTYKAQGIRFVGIRKPRLGNTDLLRLMRENGWGLTEQHDKRGWDARGLNYHDPAVRAWYAEQLGPLLTCGVDGWWNDEGEGTFTRYYDWNQAEEDAQAQFRPGIRLWTINRSFQPGLQRFGVAAWTGDIETSWEQLALTPTHILNWSLAGMPYGACDIGGFKGNPTPEMFTRWMQVGVFLPVMRAHSDHSVPPHFPWLFGPNAEQAIRKALDLRYRLIPYYYSLAHEVHTTGIPLMRPLVMEFPDDPKVVNLSDQWLMGSGLMAAPILTNSSQRTVYLPASNWYIFNSNKKLDGNRTITVTAGLDEIPIYVHAGTILPLGPVIEHTSQLPGGPLEVQVYPGKDATFTLVEDDGQTTAYLKGQIRRTTFTWDDAAQRLNWKIEGSYDGKDIFKSLKVVVFNPQGVQRANESLETSGKHDFGPFDLISLGNHSPSLRDIRRDISEGNEKLK
jgi:alpha-glucosidase